MCFGGNDVKALRKQMEMRKHSDSSDCITGQFTACNTTEKAECAGNVGGEYIYELNVKDSDSNKTIGQFLCLFVLRKWPYMYLN